jgi:DNA invertase Pin-like site-specific DNA recombinase
MAISYSRFSDPKQAKGDSEGRQDRMFREFCRRHNLTPLAEVFADKGRSGYKDEHRRKGRLGQLVAMAKDDRFESGTVIVVEAWDRLGRLRPDKQTALVAELVQTGVSIGVCRLNDIFSEEDFGTHKWTVLSTFIMLAFQESKQKADRVASSWKARRERAQKTGALLTGRIPAWLKVVNGKRVPIPERVATLKHIFKLAADGYGRARIIRTLIDEGHKPFGDSGKWTRPYVAKILNNRTALGELQPRKDDGTPDGPVLKGYYPAVITEEEYLLARAAQEGRRGRGGHRDRRYVNVFQSLLVHARDGEGFVLHNHGTAAKPQLQLVNAAGMAGRAKTATYPYPVFEEALLSQLAEVGPREVLPREDGSADRASVLRARLVGVRRDIANLQAELKEGFSKSLVAVLRQKEDEEEDVAAQLQEEMAKSVRPAERAWEDVRSLAGLVREGGDAARLKLRPVLRRIVEAIWVLTVPHGCRRLAVVQVRFAGDDVEMREYLIDYNPAGGNRPGWWRVASMRSPVYDPKSPAYAGLAPFDLSDPQGVWMVENALSVSDEDLEREFEDCPKHSLP